MADRPSIAARAPLADERFSALYRQHSAAIIRYLRRRLGDGPAEDAAAEVFMRAFRRFASFDPNQGDGSALPWLFGIAGHVVRERWRAERRRLRLLERLAETELPDRQDVDRVELDPALIRGLRALTSDDRETLLVVVWGELSYDEAAAALGVPIGTVRSRLSRARRQLEPMRAELQGLPAARGADV